MPPSSTLRRGLRAGFTLIELLAVILIISILAVALTPMVRDAIAGARVSACEANLRQIYTGIVLYETKYKRLPNKSGVRFFADLIAMGAIENTPTNAKRLTCPNVDIGFLTIGDMEPTEWFSDIERVDGFYSAYAGRNCEEFPLRSLKGSEPLVADDNDPEMNHDTTTNVLYGDGQVRAFELITERNKGTIGPEDELIVVGPDSPIEDLRKLSLD